MNLDELRSVQAKERRKDSLQHLRNTFYDDVAAYIADLRAARDRRAERVDNPFSDDDVGRMSDEIETAEEVVEALYERRVGKVVKLASFAAADMPVETEGMTSQERALFDDLVERIGENKSTVLDALSGEAPPGSGGSSADEPTGTAAEPAESPDPKSDGRDDAPDVSEESDPPDESNPPDESDVATESDASIGTEGPGEGGEASGDPDGALANAMRGPEGPTDTDGEDSTPAATDVDEPTSTDASSPTDEPSSTAGATADDPIPVDPDRAPPDSVSREGTDAATDASDGPEEPTASAEPDRTTVRITREVGAILGVDDREYDLASEDVVTLPTENAEPLVRRDAAERIE